MFFDSLLFVDATIKAFPKTILRELSITPLKNQN